MADLQAGNVFIDTQAFDAANLNFQSTPLTELIRLVNTGVVANVLMTSITEAEVRAHITERIHEAFSHLKKFRKEGRALRNIAPCASIFGIFDETAAIAELEEKFSKFLTDAKVSIVNLDGLDPQIVFNDYFEKKPPFGEGKKKHEFPDAFAQHALTKWCERHDEALYVVSRDDDWQSATNPLIPIASLEEFIDLVVTNQYRELSERVLGLYRANIEKVDKTIREAFKDSGFYTDDVDGDVNEVEITNLNIGDPLVIEIDDESATISVSVDLDYSADVSYLDDNAGIWDGEDHEWAYRPMRYEYVKESDTFDAELYVTFTAENPDSFEVSCRIGRDFRVTVLPTDYELK